ncbi:MAG: type II secretion system F family protein [archaeon]
MRPKSSESFLELKKIIAREKRIAREMSSLSDNLDKNEDLEQRKLILSHIISLKSALKNINAKIPKTLENIILIKPAPFYQIENTKTTPQKKEEPESKKVQVQKKEIDKELTRLERESLKRLRKKEQKKEHKKNKPSLYVKIANNLFSNISKSLADKPMFKTLNRDLVKANMQFVPQNYISVILFTTMLSVIGGIFVFVFFLFFNIGVQLPIITLVEEPINSRLIKVFWLLFAIPLVTSTITYFYPSMEKKAAESKINHELPFATIHMSAISNSMVEPSKIFEIIITTEEYPSIAKEFTKMINEINIHGYNLVSALRNSSFNSPSRKLADLLNGLATTITSGGDLPNFFDKRSQSFLFEYRLEREKATRAAETFMDIYISIVIAAPMILMLLLIMMKISGLGIQLSITMITIAMIMGVSVINIIFLTFLYLKQSNE